MKIRTIAYITLCCLATGGCQDDATSEGSDKSLSINIEEQELKLEENQTDTLHITVKQELPKLKQDIIRICSTDSNTDFPFEIDTIYEESTNRYAIVLADKGTSNLYNRNVYLSVSTGNIDKPYEKSDTFHVYKSFFTDLPVVYINTPEGQNVTSKETWMRDVSICIYDEKGRLTWNGMTEIKGRGNTTWTYPKKPYTLRLEKKSEILGMPAHKRWILLANYIDKTLMRNHIAFFLAKAEKTSLEWTPRGEFVDLVFNNRHVGNYYLCEQIKIDENRVNIYENGPEDTDGGFLLEFDKNFDEINKFRSATSGLPVMIKEPDENDLTKAQFNFIQEFINDVDKKIYASDFADKRDYAQDVDVMTFVDYYLIYELTGNAELGWPKSCYMYKDKGGKLKAGPVWDFDYATYGPFYYYYRKGPSNTSIWWFARLHEDPAIMQLRKERYNTLRPSLIKALDEIERVRKYIKKSAEENSRLWPIDQYDINKDEKKSFDEAVTLLRNNLQGQFEWMDNNI